MSTTTIPDPSQGEAEGTLYSSFGSGKTAVQSLGSIDEKGFYVPLSTQIEGRLESSQSNSTGGFRSIQAGNFSMPVPQIQYGQTDGDRKLETDSGPLDMDTNNVQFATYAQDQFNKGPALNDFPPSHRSSKTWVPLPLRPYFWIPLIVLLFICGIGLEVALFYNKKNLGWPSGQSPNSQLILHYVYTLPPVIVASMVVAMWAWTDLEIKRIQPYVDLVHGDSPPHRSLLLDYTRHSNFFVWTRAAANRHYLVALASLMVILSLSFQPLAAALLVVMDTWMPVPDMTMKNLAAVGLNQSAEFDDLTSFLTGAGFAGASVMYDLPPPAFVRVPYTVAPFELPVIVPNNGTAFANTTAVKTETGCVQVPVSMVQVPGVGWNNSVSYNGCSIAWSVDNTSATWFGTDTPECGSANPPQFNPIIFWFFTYTPSAQASATICYPALSLWEVNVGVDIVTGNVTKITEIGPFTQSSNFSSFSANVTGPPLNGRAYNGIKFNLTNPDQYVLARQNATQLQLPAAVLQAALQTSGSLIGSFQNNTLSVLANRVYGIYLCLIASNVYFLTDDEPITIQVKTFRKRVWLSDTAVHLLTTALFILGFFATIVQLFHREDRRYLCLKHEPGTIASAVSIGAQTGVGDVLAGRQDEKDIKNALENRKFRIDPTTMKIYMEGEDGYQNIASPTMRRRSVLAVLQGGRKPSSPVSPVNDTSKARTINSLKTCEPGKFTVSDTQALV